MSRVEILSKSAECLTESNALEKSREIIVTYSLVLRRSCVWWMIDIMAAEVEPVGLKANWSETRDSRGGWVRVGYINLWTICFSTILERTGRMEIGRKSAFWEGDLVLAFGRMMAIFHWGGIKWDRNDRLMRWESGNEKKGAVSLRNQAGKLSYPVAVGCKWSRR